MVRMLGYSTPRGIAASRRPHAGVLLGRAPPGNLPAQMQENGVLRNHEETLRRREDRQSMSSSMLPPCATPMAHVTQIRGLMLDITG